MKCTIYEIREKLSRKRTLLQPMWAITWVFRVALWSAVVLDGVYEKSKFSRSFKIFAHEFATTPNNEWNRISWKLLVIHTRTNFGDRAFGTSGPRVWNYLKTDLRQPDLSHSCFRQSPKRFLFGQRDHSAFSLHHRWTVFPVSSCIHVECSASFCHFFHITVTVQKSTQDRTIRAFIPAILLNLSLRHCDSTFLFRDLEVFGFMSR